MVQGTHISRERVRCSHRAVSHCRIWDRAAATSRPTSARNCMNEQPVKRRRGCFFSGCLTCTTLLLVVLAGLVLGYLKILNSFPDTKPAPLPTVNMTDSEMAQVRRRVDTFSQDIRSARTPGPLTLSSDELNALILTDQNLKTLKGELYVSIEGAQVKGQLSVPTARVGLGIFKHRYINGSGTFNVSLTNGTLYVTAQSLSVKGKPLPEKYMEQVRHHNLAQSFNDDPKTSVGLNKLQSIEVKDGKLVIETLR